MEQRKNIKSCTYIYILLTPVLVMNLRGKQQIDKDLTNVA